MLDDFIGCFVPIQPKIKMPYATNDLKWSRVELLYYKPLYNEFLYATILITLLLETVNVPY